ncbi:cytochrome P450 307a1 [Copidosoma floridanum]|uniref:cytochrome P450 307a1 n=1 Tax=Copidosoma floridanum TaxID=29053 RepID=UPI0006C9E1DF|nr:cytochrome P450 307a1 [Copidosoma floridanum]
MVAATMFWILLSCASTLYFVLMCMKRGVFGARLRGKSPERKSLRGPLSLPLIGSMYKLGSPEGPFAVFTDLSHKYGQIFEMQLGVSKCVIVSSYALIKEVLITKGGHFGGRPDFLRFHHLFGGDRNNSLALCDWSDLQRKRRSIARSFCSPRGGSSQQEEISRVAVDEIAQMFEYLEDPRNAEILAGERPVKPIVLAAVANMFTKYMCSTRFDYYQDEEFKHVTRAFDDIFWDINQGYAVDFLPWLKVFYSGHLTRLSDWANDIRGFILRRIIEPRRASLDLDTEIPRDFTDALLFHLQSTQSELSWQHILFELEDFLGGHSAVGNLVMMVLANAVIHPEIQTRIQEECDAVIRGKLERGVEVGSLMVSPRDKPQLPYTESVIWETLRVSSSPIVPHVATCDTDISGYPVAKDTMVFLNNYSLNLGEEYWGADARQFKPERFLKREEGETVDRVSRPDFFMPFSTGKRTCIGQKLVQGFAFVTVTMLLAKYNVSAPPTVDVTKSIQSSCLALPPDCFNLIFTKRKLPVSS